MVGNLFTNYSRFDFTNTFDKINYNVLSETHFEGINLVKNHAKNIFKYITIMSIHIYIYITTDTTAFFLINIAILALFRRKDYNCTL